MSELKSRYMWSARYKDGNVLLQMNAAGEEASINDINRSILHSITLYDENGKHVITQRYFKGQYPIYRKRTALRQSMGIGSTSGDGPYEIIHILGWRERLNESMFIEHVSFIYESNGHIEMGRFNNGKLQHEISYIDADNMPVE